MSDPYIGEIRMVAFNYAPAGWALCQGQLIAIAQNQALFALLGTFYGGNGVSNFQLPNLQGRTPVGVGQGLGLSSINIGEQGGTENATLTIANMPQHTHTATGTASGGAVTVSVVVPATTSTVAGTLGGTPGPTTIFGPNVANGRAAELYSTSTDSATGTTMKPFNATGTISTPPSITVTNGMTGSNAPVALRNPYLGVNFCIALQGVFPPHG